MYDSVPAPVVRIKGCQLSFLLWVIPRKRITRNCWQQLKLCPSFFFFLTLGKKPPPSPRANLIPSRTLGLDTPKIQITQTTWALLTHISKYACTDTYRGVRGEDIEREGREKKIEQNVRRGWLSLAPVHKNVPLSRCWLTELNPHPRLWPRP